ncbi:hypothetical protein BC938DRAFT_483509 [Jimgerdemannia flammicorona]|uniref:Uncharacterized protein n=1 Tax=Jimgerdemannia flammicorona TaxID=994334 RepID=A0A433QBZ7_9FUNG|nr:hypothetical protein BC938DRAFT_483509 [Jimgerdemannia flammicorona]
MILRSLSIKGRSKGLHHRNATRPNETLQIRASVRARRTRWLPQVSLDALLKITANDGANMTQTSFIIAATMVRISLMMNAKEGWSDLHLRLS